jgi:hypothetical protein
MSSRPVIVSPATLTKTPLWADDKFEAAPAHAAYRAVVAAKALVENQAFVEFKAFVEKKFVPPA